MRCFTAFLTREQVVLWRARGYTVVEVVMAVEGEMIDKKKLKSGGGNDGV